MVGYHSFVRFAMWTIYGEPNFRPARGNILISLNWDQTLWLRYGIFKGSKSGLGLLLLSLNFFCEIAQPELRALNTMGWFVVCDCDVIVIYDRECLDRGGSDAA